MKCLETHLHSIKIFRYGVGNISSPADFKSNSPLSNNNTPNWGTCPNPVCSISINLTSNAPTQTNQLLEEVFQPDFFSDPLFAPAL